MNLRLCLSILLLLSTLLVPLNAIEQNERVFNQEAMDGYRQAAEFDYSQDYARTDSFFSIILAYIFSKAAFLFDALELQWIFPVVFRVAILIGIIAAVVIILRLKFGKALVLGSSKQIHLPLTHIQNEKQDYERLLQESINDQQFKLAIRYLFLTSLIMLENQKNIAIEKWKAPYDYLNELPEEKKSFFKQLTDLFENTWYGDYHPDSLAVDQGLQLYRQLKDA